jgi:hypothetical protein
MLERIILEKKERVSTFIDQSTMEYAVQESVYYAAEDIYIWLTTDESKFPDKKAFETMTIELMLDEDYPIGRGFDADLKELISSDVVVVLQRDKTGESPYGFYLKTAYVNIDPEKAEETGEQYSQLPRTQGYVACDYPVVQTILFI